MLLSIGLLFIALLLVWALRIKKSSDQNGEDSQGFLIEGLSRPSRELALRIFSKQDWDFVCKEAGSEVQKVFLEERRSVSLLWLKHTRSAAGRLMNLHRRVARGNIELKASSEMKLAANYLSFLSLCAILEILIRALGPFRAQKMTGPVLGVAAELWSMSEKLLSGLTSLGHDRIDAVWTGRST